MKTLKYYPRLKIYKTPSKSLVVKDDFSEGVSFGWYKILKKINGVIFLNTYAMSDTTLIHIKGIKNLLTSKGVYFVEVEIFGKTLDSLG